MAFHWNPKKLVAILVVLLICCDISLLFAAQTDNDNSAAALQQQLQQVQQLQQQALTPTAASSAQQGSAVSTAASAPVSPPPQAALAQLPPPQGLAAPNNPVAPANTTPVGTVSVDDVNNAAFDAMTKNMLPMSSDQIQRLRQLFDQSQFAASALPNTPARGVISSQFVNLAPGSTPPVIRLQQGMVSVLSFLDSTGAPWPIQAYDIGNPSAFNIQWNKSDNTLMFQPLTPYPYANMAIMLQGLSTPLILTLTSGQKAFDARLDMHVQGLGPNAQAAPSSAGLPNGPSPELLGVLDGVPPTGSTILHVTGGAAQAWLSNGHIFVRTRYTVISPGWLATMSSADGMKAYEMPQAPMLLAMRDGKIIQLKLEGL
jgi:intracellular multiplication protein IcmK